MAAIEPTPALARAVVDGRLRDTEEPFDVAPGEQGPVELLELADGVGDGFAGTVEVLQRREGGAGSPGGGFARAAPPVAARRR